MGLVMNRTAIAAFLGPCLLVGCAMQRYQSAPIAAGDTAKGLEARTLADPALRAFEQNYLGHPIPTWPPATWDLQALSIAAFYFNPVLDEARARIAQSRAAMLTAAARPNPTLNVAPGIPSPYLLTLDLSVPLETAGKRGYRVQEARSLDQAARFDLADSAWKVRSLVRAALLNCLTASQRLGLLRSEAEFRGDRVNLLEHMVSAGEIPRSDLDEARIESSKTRLAIRTAEGELADDKAALAAAIGVPVEGIRDAQFTWQDMNTPPSLEILSLEEIKRDAILNRLDVRSALAQYAAAEAGLQLEIARQYPDINIGPGYTYEERRSYFTVGLSAAVPLFDRNQGPIGEAEARRKEAAAAFLETQAQVIAKSERALAVYTAALQELAEAQHLETLQGSQRQAVRASVRLGEQDRIDLDAVEIQGTFAAHARLEALGHAQSALGDLEDAVQRPLAVGEELPIDPESPALNKPTGVSKE